MDTLALPHGMFAAGSTYQRRKDQDRCRIKARWQIDVFPIRLLPFTFSKSHLNRSSYTTLYHFSGRHIKLWPQAASSRIDLSSRRIATYLRLRRLSIVVDIGHESRTTLSLLPMAGQGKAPTLLPNGPVPIKTPPPSPPTTLVTKALLKGPARDLAKATGISLSELHQYAVSTPTHVRNSVLSGAGSGAQGQ